MRHTGPVWDAIHLLRVRQWVKNAFVTAPLVFSARYLQGPDVLRTAAVFAAFCLISSAVYVFNDFMDRDLDRNHPTKRTRPLASGRIPAWAALAGAFALLLGAGGVSILLEPGVRIALVTYIGTNILYSLVLKRIAIVDVMMISFGFLLRVVAGGLAIGVPVSRWMLLNTFFLSLFIGFGKRRAETVLSREHGAQRSVLDQYNLPLLDGLLLVCAGLTIVSYSLYVLRPSTTGNPTDTEMILTVPLVVVGLFRYLFLVYARQKGEDAAEAILSDPLIALDLALWVAACIALQTFGDRIALPWVD